MHEGCDYTVIIPICLQKLTHKIDIMMNDESTTSQNRELLKS